SSALAPAYQQWRTEREEGAFPEVMPGAQSWVHMNRAYHAGKWIEARGEGLTALRLEVSAEPDLSGSGFSMTAINPAYGQAAHILQAFRNPGQNGVFHLEPGVHMLFRGTCGVAE